MSARLAKLRERLAARELDAFLSFDAITNRYLCGFSGSTSALIVTIERAIFVTDFRYREQARSEMTGFELREAVSSLIAEVCAAIRDTESKKVGFEPEQMTFKSYEEVRTQLSAIELQAAQRLVSDLRAIKDPAEAEKMRRAAQIASEVISDVPLTLAEGMSERELAAEIEYLIRKKGADTSSFDAIALFGERSSLPHGKPSDRRLTSGDIVLVDFGARLNGYNSDLTRTWVYRRIRTARTREVYETVQSAQEAALRAVKPGMSCAKLDAIARDIIKEAGYGDNFGHGLGHGVGLDVHESPRISADSADRLEEGMVTTIEPGIYIPGEGGIRIEDLVLVTASGCKVLTCADKQLTVI